MLHEDVRFQTQSGEGSCRERKRSFWLPACILSFPPTVGKLISGDALHAASHAGAAFTSRESWQLGGLPRETAAERDVPLASSEIAGGIPHIREGTTCQN